MEELVLRVVGDEYQFWYRGGCLCTVPVPKALSEDEVQTIKAKLVLFYDLHF